MLIFPLWLTICLNGSQISPCCSQWRIQGRGPGAPGPPYFQTKLRHRRTEKICLETSPPSQDLDAPPPPPRYLTVWIRHWYPTIVDNPIIWTAAKSQANMNYRCLTEINSRYDGLSLLKVPIVPAIKGVDCTSADSQENNEFSFEVGVGGDWELRCAIGIIRMQTIRRL